MIYRKVKSMLETALEDVANKGELTSSNLDIIEKLIHSIKNLCEIEEDKRNSNENNSFDSRPSRIYNYDYGMDDSWDDREMMRSQAQRRDNRDRYTRDHESEINEIITEMHELKNRVTDPKTKHKIEGMIRELRP